MRGITTCGSSYLLQTTDKTLTIGSCAGILPSRTSRPLVLTRGAVFYVRVSHETSGELDFPIPDSTSRAVVRTGRRGYVIQYRAQSPGTTYLVARGTPFCDGIDPHRGTCRFLEIRVRGA